MPGPSQSRWARALQLFHAGDLAQAEGSCLQIVQETPQDASAWNLLGVIASQTAKVEASLEYFRCAVDADPTIIDYRCNRAVVLKQHGRLQEAESDYREVLRIKPTHVDSLVALGNVVQDQGRLDEADAVYRRALELQPRASVHTDLGLIHWKLRRLDDAAAWYRQALELNPAAPEANFNLAVVLFEQERFAEAEPLYRRALELRSDYVDALNNLGNVLRKLQRYAEAEACYRRALVLKPGQAELYGNLGLLFRDWHRPADAEAAYRSALEWKPDFVEAHNQLGESLHVQARYEEAEVCYRRALQLKSNDSLAYNNLGMLFQDVNRHEERAECFRRALELTPADPTYHLNLGNALRDLGKFSESEQHYRRALELKPDYAEAHTYLGILLLTQGDYAHGWSEYEWRRRLSDYPHTSYAQPSWDGSSLAGRTILLCAEQGIGDTLQFIRYAPLVKKHGGTVLLRCPAELCSLLSRCAGIDAIVSGENRPRFDVYAPLLSLPRLFGATFPAAPYLTADPALVKTCGEGLASVHNRKVGIVWQGNPRHPRDRQRSVPLTHFEPLAHVPGVQLISLQVGPGQTQITERFAVLDLGSRFDPSTFEDAAAALMNLDLVVTVDTVLAHLAGALGVPAWLALPDPPDWRWLRGREDSPWYPSIRLFRQAKAGEWDNVFARMANELSAIV